MLRGTPISLPPAIGLHKEYDERILRSVEEFLSLAPDEQTYTQIPIRPITVREVPKRYPHCWKINPPDPDYAQHFVLADTIFIDTTFRRLCQGSPSFQAMLKLCREISYTPASMNQLNSVLGEYLFSFQEVDVNYELMENSTLTATPLAVLAHEYRHSYQSRQKSAFTLDAPIEISQFFALALAGEADAMCFGIVCAYETLLHEGHSQLAAQNILQAEENTLGENLVRMFNHTQRRQGHSYLTGEFSNAITFDFLTRGNAMLEIYTQRYHDKHQQLTKAPMIPTATPIKTANINENGQLIINTPASPPPPNLLQSAFNRLRHMPYVDSSGNIQHRPFYMNKLTPEQFHEALFI